MCNMHKIINKNKKTTKIYLEVVKSGWKWLNFVLHSWCKGEEYRKMFLGEYEHSIDQKNRLRIPPKFRKDFSEGAIVTKGNDGCLFLVAKTQFSNIFQNLNSLPIFDSKLQIPVRMLFSSACEVEEDNQGRFLLPQNLKAFAGIAKDVVFVGVGNRVELWSKERWQDYSNKANSNFDQILQSLGEYGI